LAWFLRTQLSRPNGSVTVNTMNFQPSPQPTGENTRSLLAQVLHQFRSAFIGVGLFSALINLLMLSGSMFMLQIYDRVLPSKSVPTLIGLSLIFLGLYAFQAILDLIRARVLVRIGSAFDESIAERVYGAVLKLPLKGARTADALQPVRDLDTIRNFLTGLGPTALFDLPWMPLYLGLCFVFNFYIGLAATVGAIIIVALTVITEITSRAPIRDVAKFGAARSVFAEASRVHSEVLHALGMTGRMGDRWREANAQFSDAQQRVSDVTGGLGSIAKVLRLVLQSAVLGVGAYLVIQQQATAGIIIASSIITARALAPVDIAIANWKGFGAARQSWRRLTSLLAALPVETDVLQLPKPSASLSVENVAVVPPGSKRTVVQGISFNLQAGSALGIVGPSASGKSSLVRALLGVWPASFGTVRIDGAELTQWSRDSLGRHMGYLPQDVSLCDGTVAENISRFETNPSSNAIIAAAQAAGVHDLILTLPNGYDTAIGERGETLSAGYRQRIGLARALYGDPFLVILDEPNSNLDMEGELALTKAIRGVCQRGGIVIVIAHRPSVLTAVDLVLAVVNGQTRAFGKREEVLAPMHVVPNAHPAPNATPQRIVA
jgi:ATP-binding cassette, subfamily C, type I secretion system permease/ATPase